MRSVNEGKSSSSSPPLACDVALGLKMQCNGDGGGAAFFGYTWRSLDSTDLRASGGRGASTGTTVSGKALFTPTQWQELERQQMIHKYMMASVPVPPQLLFSPSLPSAAPQSNTSGLDLRYSTSGSDPEPWRCRRTDGKKWRCSRDVAPDQKYCDRHAHKSRPRSRKPVELSSHNTTANSQPLPPTHSNISNPRPQSLDHSRFNRGAGQQWQQLIQTPSLSSRLEFKKKDGFENTDEYPVRYEDKHGLSATAVGCLQRFENDHHHQMTNGSVHDGIAAKGLLPANLSNKFSPSSLTLSIPGWNGIDGNNENPNNLGMMTMNSTDKDSDSILKLPQWMNTNPNWAHSSAPGGPLGEALCLGNASLTRSGSNLQSPRTTSSSRSSCDDGGHAFSFIG